MGDEGGTGDDRKRKERGFKPRVEFGDKRKGARSFILTPEGAFQHEDGKLETIADAVDLFWDAVARNPAQWATARIGYRYLIDNAAQADREDVRRTLGWLEMALAERERDAAVAASRLLEAMPSPLLAADYSRLIAIFNSRKVGMVWALTPGFDKTPLPRGPIPRFGQEAGFGLIRAVPGLYEKLALFGPEMEEIVIGLVEEAIRYKVSLPESLMALAKRASGPGGPS